jgi:hypothetical protein
MYRVPTEQQGQRAGLKTGHYMCVRRVGGLGEGLEEEGEHAVAGDVGEGGEFQGVVAAGEFEGAGVGTVAAEGVEHLAGEFGEHGGVVLAVEHEGVASGAHAALNVGHGADGGPVVAELIDTDMVSKTFPDVIGRHTLADDIGVVGGDVEEATGADAFIVNEGDIADRRAKAGAEDAELGVTLLFEPVEAAAGVLDGLSVGLEGEADIRAADLVGALVAADHAAVVVGHAHLEDGDAHALNPVAEAVLAVPFSVPVGEEEDRGALLLPPKELGMNDVVFRPGRFDGTGESEDVFCFKCGRRATDVEAVIGGWGGGIPVPAVLDGFVGILVDERARIGLIGGAADVLEAPVEGLDAAIVVGGPAAVLVAADFAFEPVHKKTVLSS